MNNHCGTTFNLRQRWSGLGNSNALLFLFSFLMLALSGVGPVSADTTNAPGATGEPYTLGANNGMATLDDQHELSVGDHLFFQIIEDTDDPKQLVVTDSGDIQVPCVGHVAVKGMTCKRLAFQLKKELEAKYYHHATVIILVDLMSNNLGNVYVSGAVHTPGRLQIPGNEVFTLSKALLCAGGFTELADKHNVTVTRRSETGATNELFKVDLVQILEKGKTQKDLPLKHGDMIFVPEHFNIF